MLLAIALIAFAVCCGLMFSSSSTPGGAPPQPKTRQTRTSSTGERIQREWFLLCLDYGPVSRAPVQLLFYRRSFRDDIVRALTDHLRKVFRNDELVVEQIYVKDPFEEGGYRIIHVHTLEPVTKPRQDSSRTRSQRSPNHSANARRATPDDFRRFRR